jgi:TonB family protein
MLDLNIPSPNLILSPKGRWWKACLISVLGHGCLAMTLLKEYTTGPSQNHTTTHFDLCFIAPPEPAPKPQKKSPLPVSAPQENQAKQTVIQEQESLKEGQNSSHLSSSTPSPIPCEANLPPEYPDQAREQGIEGTVYIQVTINLKGCVTHAKVLPPRCSLLLEQAALRAVKEWRFHPPLTPFEAQIPIHFQLEN